MKKLSDKLAHDILLDPVDFKLILAKYYLEKIGTSVLLDYDWAHFQLESYAESFLYYCDMCIEIIMNDINKEFALLNDNEDLGAYKIRTKLDKANIRERLVFNILTDYFLYPKKVDNDWDITSSKLWQLRELRNHIAHEPIINRAAIRGAGDRTDYLFRFSWTIIDENTGTRQTMNLDIIVSNPHEDFQLMFNELVRFVERIRKIVPYKYSSYQHRNQLDFEL